MLDPYVLAGTNMSCDQVDGELHPGRHSIRLKGADYSAAGFYLLTICSYERKCMFGHIERATVHLTALGQIVFECSRAIPDHFPYGSLLEFVVMPNHTHGILQVGRSKHHNTAAFMKNTGVLPRSVGAIVRSFKSEVTRRARLELGLVGNVWQRNYYERILRVGKELMDARAYIRENPRKWEWDRNNPEFRKQRG